jgi:amino acid transporter
MLLISIGKLNDLATLTVMLLLIVFALVNISVLVLRRARPRPGRVAWQTGWWL